MSCSTLGSSPQMCTNVQLHASQAIGEVRWGKECKHLRIERNGLGMRLSGGRRVGAFCAILRGNKRKLEGWRGKSRESAHLIHLRSKSSDGECRKGGHVCCRLRVFVVLDIVRQRTMSSRCTICTRPSCCDHKQLFKLDRRSVQPERHRWRFERLRLESIKAWCKPLVRPDGFHLMASFVQSHLVSQTWCGQKYQKNKTRGRNNRKEMADDRLACAQVARADHNQWPYQFVVMCKDQASKRAPQPDTMARLQCFSELKERWARDT